MKKEHVQSRSRRYGCTVTWRDEDGVDHVVAEQGGTLRALTAIVEKTPIPPGGIRSISTWKSIYRDLTLPPRTYGGKAFVMSVDPYSNERSLLMQIGRLDLMPDDAYQGERPT